MSENEIVTFIQNGEETEVSLTDIASIDMSQVEEVRFENRPAGMYHMKVIDAKVTALGKEKPTPAVVIECEVQNCMSLVDGSDTAAQIGKTHRETFFMKDGDGIGRLKAFLVDTGFQGTGSMKDVLDAFHGHEFDGIIKHKVDKNDTDRVYVNFAPGKVKPHAGAATANTMPSEHVDEVAEQPAQAAGSGGGGIVLNK